MSPARSVRRPTKAGVGRARLAASFTAAVVVGFSLVGGIGIAALGTKVVPVAGAGISAAGLGSPGHGVYVLQNYTPLMASARIAGAGCASSAWQVSFNASAVGGVPPYNYSWRFGDSSPVSNVQNPVHVYAGYGMYTAWATSWDSQGHHNAAPVSVSTQHCSTGGGGAWYSPTPASPGYWVLVGGLVLAVAVAIGVAVWAVRGRRPPPEAAVSRGQAAADLDE